jgi:hypothetical protein
MRVAQRPGAGALSALVLGLLCSAAACNGVDRAHHVRVLFDVERDAVANRPEARVRFVIHDAAGRAVRGARVTLEGHMAHPGMEPVLAPAVEVSEGVYEARPEFTMAGDWSLTVSGTLPDGSRIVHDGPYTRYTAP